MGIVIPCGVVNLETCSVDCYADAGFENAEGSQCGLVSLITLGAQFSAKFLCTVFIVARLIGLVQLGH